MTIGIATDFMRQGINLLLLLTLPSVGAGLAVGLLISLFQAVTQIQEQTLTFVPKMIVVFIVISITFPWMVTSLISWATVMWSTIPRY